MIGSLGNALEALKETLIQQPGIMPVLERDTLEQRFHGLNVSQIAKLVDAPALAAIEHRDGDGVLVHRLMIDGRDRAAKQALLEQAVLERPTPAHANEVDEIVMLDGGAVQATLVRDHNDRVYTLREGRAEIDPDLTEALRVRHRVGRPSEGPAAPEVAYRPPVVVSDPAALATLIGTTLERIGAVHAKNRAAYDAIRLLMQASGETDIAAALEAADATVLRRAFAHSLAAAQEIEALLDDIRAAMRSVMLSIASARPAHPLAAD
jgi:hypothetical protein